MDDKNEVELIEDCHGVTEVKRMTAVLGVYSIVSWIDSLEHMKRAHKLVTSLSKKTIPGAL